MKQVSETSNLNKLPRRAAALHRRQRVKERPGCFPGMREAERRGSRPASGTDEAKAILAQEIERRERADAVASGVVEGGQYKPRPIPLTLDHLHGTPTRAVEMTDPAGTLAYLCATCPRSGDPLYRLCKTLRVGSVTADVVTQGERKQVYQRVPLACLSVVLTV